MQTDFREGFIIYRNGKKEPAYVCVHSGPALENPVSRDNNSETVASLCWMKTGGTLIISTLPRKRAFGIDFNRGIPPKPEALAGFKYFISKSNRKFLHEYRKKYAWTAKDNEDYDTRLKIYNRFWKEVKKNFFVLLIHTALTRLRFVPSIMDISSFDDKIISKEEFIKIINSVNSDYSDFFKKIENEYKTFVLLEEERAIINTFRIYNKFGLEKIDIDFLDKMKMGLNLVKKYCGPSVYNDLQKKFTQKKFIRAVKLTLEKMPAPKITYEHIFRGERSYGPKRELKEILGKNRVIVQFEPVYFMSFWYPNETSQIITDIINRVLERISR